MNPVLRKRVLKFGGTCLSNRSRFNWIKDVVKKEVVNTIHPIIVVSAISVGSKNVGTTNNLIGALQTGCPIKRDDHLAWIMDDHLFITNELISDQKIKNKLYAKFEDTLDGVETLCKSNEMMNDQTHFFYDQVIKHGEILSASIMSEFLIEQGITTDNVDLSSLYENGTDFSQEQINNFPSIRESLSMEKECTVLGGFIGDFTSSGGILNVLDRGYSDYTAAIIGSVVDAESLDIYKESSGIYTMNPMEYEDGKLITNMSYEELMLITAGGNEALNRNAVKIVKEKEIPVRIVKAFDNKFEHTLISKRTEPYTSIVALTETPCSITRVKSQEELCKLLEQDTGNVIGISQIFEDTCVIRRESRGEMVQISLIGDYMNNKVGVAHEIIGILSNDGINIITIIQNSKQNCISFVVDGFNGRKAIEALRVMVK